MDRAIHVGCGGWNYPAWRGLQNYAEDFKTVEVNSTFYALAKPEVVARWVEQTPADFVFSVKASRYLTHRRRLREMNRGIARFHETIEPLIKAGKLGPVLWQLPPSFRRNDERLAYALRGLSPGRHAFEFRHPSWFTDEVYELLRAHGVALVIGDGPETADFQTHEFTADWTYVRFHCGRRGRRGNYSKSELEEWAQRVERWRSEVEVFLYFNNGEGFAVQNALWLAKRLA